MDYISSDVSNLGFKNLWLTYDLNKEMIGLRRDNGNGAEYLCKIPKVDITCWQLLLRFLGCGELKQISFDMRKIANELLTYKDLEDYTQESGNTNETVRVGQKINAFIEKALRLNKTARLNGWSIKEIKGQLETWNLINALSKTNLEKFSPDLQKALQGIDLNTKQVQCLDNTLRSLQNASDYATLRKVGSFLTSVLSVTAFALTCGLAVHVNKAIHAEITRIKSDPYLIAYIVFTFGLNLLIGAAIVGGIEIALAAALLTTLFSNVLYWMNCEDTKRLEEAQKYFKDLNLEPSTMNKIMFYTPLLHFFYPVYHEFTRVTRLSELTDALKAKLLEGAEDCDKNWNRAIELFHQEAPKILDAYEQQIQYLDTQIKDINVIQDKDHMLKYDRLTSELQQVNELKEEFFRIAQYFIDFNSQEPTLKNNQPECLVQ